MFEEVTCSVDCGRVYTWHVGMVLATHRITPLSAPHGNEHVIVPNSKQNSVHGNLLILDKGCYACALVPPSRESVAAFVFFNGISY